MGLIENLQTIKNEKDTKIIPENIKKDVQIFDITGTYEGSGSSGDVKLFSTVQEMNQSTGNVDGDLAEVYNINIKGIQENNYNLDVSNIYIPDTIIFTKTPVYNTSQTNNYVCFDGTNLIKGFLHAKFEDNQRTLRYYTEFYSYSGDSVDQYEFYATSNDGLTFSFDNTNKAIKDNFVTFCSGAQNSAWSRDDMLNCFDNDTVNIVYRQKPISIGLYEYHNDQWEARDLGLNASSSSIITGNKAFSNNQIVKGTYNPVTAKDAFYRFYGLDSYDERCSFPTLQIFNNENEVTQDLPDYSMRLMVKNDNSPKFYGRFYSGFDGPNSFKLKQINLENSGLYFSNAIKVVDEITSKVYEVFYNSSGSTELVLYDQYNDELHDLTYNSNSRFYPSMTSGSGSFNKAFMINNNKFYTVIDQYKIGVYDILTKTWKVFETGLNTRIYIVYVYNDIVIISLFKTTSGGSYGGRPSYKCILDFENNTLSKTSFTEYFSYYDSYTKAGKYFIYGESLSNDSSLKDTFIYDAENNTKTSLNVKNIYDSFNQGKIVDNIIYFSSASLDLNTLQYTQYHTKASGVTWDYSRIVLKNVHPNGIDVKSDNWDYFGYIGVGQPDQWGYDKYTFVTIYNGVITYLDNTMILGDPNIQVIEDGFLAKDGTYVNRNYGITEKDNQYYLYTTLNDIFGFDIYPLNKNYSDNTKTSSYVLHRNIWTEEGMGMREPFNCLFGNPEHLNLKEYKVIE